MPYRSTPQDRRNAQLIGVVYVVLAIALGWMLIKIWPPIPWPLKNADEDKSLAGYLVETRCPEETSTATPTPTPTPTPSAASVPATNNQTPAPTRAGNAGQTGTQPTTPAVTQVPAGAQAGTQPAGQPGTTGGTQSPTGGQPANPTPVAQPDAAKNSVAGNRSGQSISLPITVLGICRKTTFDERLILLVIVAGILGAFVHGATSLADYLGNNTFNSSWTWFYFLRPAIGMSLALVFYFVIRGGFLSTTGGAADINPYGIAALAGLVGMFSKQATDKLSEVFGTLFRAAPGQGDAKRQDPLKPPPVPITLNPANVVAGSEAFKLTVSGTGFVQGDSIKVNDVAQTTTLDSPTTLSATIPKEAIANPATLKVTVVNPDQTVLASADLVVTAPGGTAPGATAAGATAPGTTTPTDGTPPPASPPLGDTTAEETPVSGEETGDNELIDGCDVDMKPDTPDEDLPITKGGVN